MAYESRHLRRPKIRYDNANDDNPLVFQGVVSGAKITPSAYTIQIFDTGGSEVLAATATGITVVGTTVLNYSVVTTTEADYPVGTGYRAHWILTSGTPTYEFDQIFDIVKFVPFGWIGRDQLVALDARVKAMEHDGDEDFSEIIEAVRGEVQLDVEMKALEEKQMLEDMIPDQTRLAIPSRYLILSRLFRENGQTDDAEYYEKLYKDKLTMVLAGAKLDKNQDMIEDSQQGGVHPIRLVM